MCDLYVYCIRSFPAISQGHEHLVEALQKGPTTIAIGSSTSVQSMNNPWSVDEREAMIREWLGDREAKIVQIADINDPKLGGTPPIFMVWNIVTSDEETKILYEKSDFPVEWVI